MALKDPTYQQGTTVHSKEEKQIDESTKGSNT